jgi:hypothetical protein
MQHETHQHIMGGDAQYPNGSSDELLTSSDSFLASAKLKAACQRLALKANS